MDNLEDPVKKVTAESAEAEKSMLAAAGLEKFRDLKTLAEAYRNLEAEFTRRSQRLRELEEGNKAEAAPDGAPLPSSQNKAGGGEPAAEREAVIGEYLKNLAANRGVPVMIGGSAVAAPVNRPATVKEAGKLAQIFLNGKEENN